MNWKQGDFHMTAATIQQDAVVATYESHAQAEDAIRKMLWLAAELAPWEPDCSASVFRKTALSSTKVI